MMAKRIAEAAGGADRSALKAELFSEDYLIARPLLQAMRPNPKGPPVLLIDEIDRTDAPFEAFLLEALSDFQVIIPEHGTIKAPEPPLVILTTNRTREVHDKLKRRCLYHWVDYPDFDREMAEARRVLAGLSLPAPPQPSRRVLGQVAVVLLISDGLDRDDGDVLGRATQRLGLTARRLVWVNLLMRWADFAPKARGIRAMMPHVSSFRAGHNIAALEGLAAAITDSTDRGEKDRMLALMRREGGN